MLGSLLILGTVGRDQQQLYLVLYMEHLLYGAGTAITEFVQFADKKVEGGYMKKNHLIFPGKRQLRKWIMSIGHEDNAADTESPDSMEAGSNNVYLGAGFRPRKDPEHLPPATACKGFPHIQTAMFYEKEGSEELFRAHTSALSLPRHLLASLLSRIIEFLLC
jgi:hypothetical protein